MPGRSTALVASAMVVAGLGIGGCGREAPKADTTGRISEFGKYEGYSEEKYSGWVRHSQYITMRDGVKLAVDIVRPAVDGVAVDDPYPVLWTHSRYHRNPDAIARFFAEMARREAEAKGEEYEAPDLPEGVISQVDASPFLQRMVKEGYVVVSVGVRGSGASYGRYEGLFSPNETADAYDIMEWISSQPWCDGNLGMWGGSYLGITQYMAASTGHPALKAIFPNVALFDMYDALYAGGIYREDMIDHWGKLTRTLDVEALAPVVDEDPDGKMRAEAIAQHQDNWDVIEEFGAAEFRDHDTASFAWSRHSPSSVLDRMNRSGVAAYHWGGWFDVFAMDEGLWFVNWTGPDKMGMGPWSHSTSWPAVDEERGRIAGAEHHRWFDYWLKGIDNGIMDEPPIHYAVIDVPGETWSWTSASSWPPAGVHTESFFFVGGPSGSVGSANDGLLVAEAPAGAGGADRYTVDLTTTTGASSRWDNAVGAGTMVYPDMTANDEKSLTYTTAPLERDLTVVGHPVVNVYLTSSASDGDVHALLEEVDAEGVSHYLSEGMLRISHRHTTKAPWDNLGLPYQESFEGDVDPLEPGEVAELRFDLEPSAVLFNAGNRVRVTIMGSDHDNTEAPPGGTPTIRLLHDAEHPSRIELPVLRGQ